MRRAQRLSHAQVAITAAFRNERIAIIQQLNGDGVDASGPAGRIHRAKLIQAGIAHQHVQGRVGRPNLATAGVENGRSHIGRLHHPRHIGNFRADGRRTGTGFHKGGVRQNGRYLHKFIDHMQTRNGRCRQPRRFIWHNRRRQVKHSQRRRGGCEG